MAAVNCVEVHQFSRAFINIHKDPHYGWVSGGYDTNNPIFRESTPVPEVIVNEVRKRNFAINDNYQPRQNELAFIARTIYDFDHDRKIYRTGYAVLGVANLQNDGGRPLIGYRYFWLDLSQAIALKYPDIQPETEEFPRLLLGIDGIWTLVDCWLRCGQAKFSMGEDDRSPYKIYAPYHIHEYPRIQQDSHETNQTIVRFNPLVNKINDKTLKDFHSQIVLKYKTKYALSWAYNVKVLEKPVEFLGIALTSDAPHLNPISFQPASAEVKESSSEPDEKPVITSSDSGEIKQALKELVKKANSSDLILKDVIKRILDYRASDRSQWGEAHIDQNMSRNSFIYNAILSVFCPNLEHISLWYQSQFLPRVEKQAARKKSSFPLGFGQAPDDPELTSVLKIQRLVFDCIQEIESYEKRNILEKNLIDSVYNDLEINLINHFLNENKWQEKEWEREWKQSKYLLSEDTIWNACWVSYMDTCLEQYFLLSSKWWESNIPFWRLSENDKRNELVVLKNGELKFDDSRYRSYLKCEFHEKVIRKLVIPGNSSNLPDFRQRNFGKYKVLASLAEELNRPGFVLFFSRLSGNEAKFKPQFSNPPNTHEDLIDRILRPSPLPPPPPPIVLFVILGVIVGWVSAVIPSSLDLLFATFTCFFVFLILLLKDVGFNIGYQILAIFFGILLTLIKMFSLLNLSQTFPSLPFVGDIFWTMVVSLLVFSFLQLCSLRN